MFRFTVVAEYLVETFAKCVACQLKCSDYGNHSHLERAAHEN